MPKQGRMQTSRTRPLRQLTTEWIHALTDLNRPHLERAIDFRSVIGASRLSKSRRAYHSADTMDSKTSVQTARNLFVISNHRLEICMQSTQYRDAAMVGHVNWREQIVLANEATERSARIPCFCDVQNGDEYCGEACRRAGSEDVEIACQCDHPACLLGVRGFTASSVAADHVAPRTYVHRVGAVWPS